MVAIFNIHPHYNEISILIFNVHHSVLCKVSNPPGRDLREQTIHAPSCALSVHMGWYTVYDPQTERVRFPETDEETVKL